MDLLDYLRGRMSCRRLWVLIGGLPQESRTQTALRDASEQQLVEVSVGPGSFGPWALANYQLAGLIDAIRRLEFVVARVNGNESYPVPEPTPRPGMNRPVRRQSPAAVTYLDRLRAGG